MKTKLIIAAVLISGAAYGQDYDAEYYAKLAQIERDYDRAIADSDRRMERMERRAAQLDALCAQAYIEARDAQCDLDEAWREFNGPVPVPVYIIPTRSW